MDVPMVPMQELLELKIAAMSEGIRAELRGLRAEVAEARVASTSEHAEVRSDLRRFRERVETLEKHDVADHSALATRAGLHKTVILTAGVANGIAVMVLALLALILQH